MRILLNRRQIVQATLTLPMAAVTAARADNAVPRGRLYGAALRADRLDDPVLRRRVADSCQWITPEFDWNWNALEYERGRWWWERADALVAFTRAGGQQVRGHMLVWDQSTPDWAKAEMAAKRDWRLVERWFAGALGRYADAACEWDVVNEAIDTEHGERGLRRTCFHRAFGERYIADAFHTARALAPRLPLMLNEYGLDYANPVERDRRGALVALVERLKRQGVPVDGVGIQAHLDLAKGPLDAAGISTMLRAIADMGLHVTITELDVMEADRSLDVERRDQAVADEVRRYLDIVLAEPAVKGVTSWGMSDRDSWLQGQPGADPAILNRGLPFDAAMRPKPAYRAIRDAMANARRIA